MPMVDTSKLPPGLLGYDPTQGAQGTPLAAMLGPQVMAMLGGAAPMGGAPTQQPSMPPENVTPHGQSSAPLADPQLSSDLNDLGIGADSAKPQPQTSSDDADLNSRINGVLAQKAPWAVRVLGGLEGRAKWAQLQQAQIGQLQGIASFVRAQQLARGAAANGDDADAAAADPLGYEKIRQQRMEPTNLKADESRFLGNSTLGAPGRAGFATAPKTLVDNGRVVEVVNGQAQQLGDTGPSVKYTADGQGYDERGLSPSSKFPALPVYKTFGATDSHQWTTPPGSPGSSAALPPTQRAGGSPALAAMTNNGKLDPVAFFKGFVGPNEGGYNPSDMNGSPTNHGINQAANPDVDVRNLSADGAAQIFANKYFRQAGAANLSPALAAVHADTSFINPGKAKALLAQSGGDPAKYLQLRQQWMQGLVARNPAAAKYAKAWSTRNAGLASLISGAGGDDTAGASQPTGTQGDDGLVRGQPIYRQNADGSQTNTATGESSKGPNAFGPEQILSARKDFLGSDDYREATQATSAFNSLNDALAKFGGNNGVIDTAAVANLARAETGLSARQGTMDTVMSHLGLPAEVEGKASNLFGKGPVTVQSLQQLHGMLGSYVTSKRQIAQARLDNEESTAHRLSGGSSTLGLALGPLNPIPKVQWFNGAADTPDYARPGRGGGGNAPPGGMTGLVSRARAAIAQGADPAIVKQRLVKMGYTGAL